jgi:gamma-glutamyl-gamma-aminobutyrate hydrolase PuuD
MAHEMDGFIITGGDDTPTRRTTELKLATAMMMRQKPILGICHGCFLLTDVLGGTVDTKHGHHGGVEHIVKYRDQDVVVNSYHDLAIKQPQSSAQVLAVDPEGDCEAWIDGLTAGIVWHPERSQDPWIPNEISKLFFKETT